MRSAVDRRTLARVDPADAIRGRGRYICGCCDAPVHLVQAFTSHFAHDRYQARPDCEDYIWSDYRYTGRPSRMGAALSDDADATSPIEHEEISHLAFEMTLDGPRLVVFLPPAKSAIDGFVEVIAGSARRIPLAHVVRGLRLSFPLHHATWTVRASEEVSEKYLTGLSLGRHSLEPDRNLFAASHGFGRLVPERAAVVLGDSVWWIGRTDIRLQPTIPANVNVDHVANDHGWHVFIVTLPETASEDEANQIAQWLQRRIQPRRPRVWIESPFARGYREDRVPIYAVSDGPLIFSSDQTVSLEVSTSIGTTLFDARSIFASMIPDELVGELSIFADGVRVARVERRAEVPRALPSVIVQLSDSLTTDLVELQRHIDNAQTTNASGITALLRWHPPLLKPRLRHRGAVGVSTAIEAELRLAQGSVLDFDKLGYAAWPLAIANRDSSATTTFPRGELFRWLESMGAPSSGSRRLTLHPREELKARFPQLRRIAQMSWPIELAAQVRTAAQVLEGIE